MKTFLLIISFGIAITILAADAFKSIPFENVIPKEDQKRMGLQKLSEEEKEKLKEFILQQCVDAYEKGRSASSSNQSTIKQKPLVYEGGSSGHWIKENIDRGTFILLEDGSLWEIDPLDKIDASLWLKIENITITTSNKGGVGYDYLLINTDDKAKAHAKYIGKK